MKIITPGHRYELNNFESPETTGQIIQFIEKTQAGTNSSKLITVNDGTTNEEVLTMLIDRVKSLQSKFPCDENALVIGNLMTALWLLNKRTQERKSRGVEGLHKA